MRKTVRVTALMAALLAAGAARAAEGHGGSAEDQISCTPDVYRFCTAQIPDEDAIVACLKAHKSALSAACGRVFSAPSGAEQAVPQDDE